MSYKSLRQNKNFDVFNLLSTLEKNESSNHTERITKFKKGTYIYHPDDEADNIYYVLDGRVKIGVLGTTSKEVIKTIVLKEDIFGESALFSQGGRGEFAYVMEDSEICICPVQDFKTLMASNAPLRDFMWHVVGKRVISIEKRLVSLVFKDSRSRILEFLIDLIRTKGQRIGYEILVRRFNTHQEIANLTGTSRQTVTTTLNELRNKDILTFDRKRLLIRNLGLLEKEATMED